MRNSTLTLLGLLAMPLVACTGDDSSTSERRPFRDSWRTVVDADFVHTVADGSLISDLKIGGREFNDNFANRGDVIVNFDGPQDKILVEFRRLTTNTNQDAAEADFDAMTLWAYNTSVTQPTKPSAMDDEDRCGEDAEGKSLPWATGCGVRVYYDGQTQLGRAGADIRVTLPADYRRTVTIITEDADEDGDYLNRGNVCVNGSNGSVDVELQSGTANIIVADGSTPAPACGAPPNTTSNPSDEVEACDTFENSDGDPAAWSTDCSCAMTGIYGVVKVESDTSASTNITVDIPGDLWASITAENLGDTPDKCVATIDVPGLILDDAGGNEFKWEGKGSVNAPSDAITPGAGYNIQARSGQCGPVSGTGDPKDFVGLNKGSMQDSELHGNTTVCVGCIRAMSCDDLI
ncbi:MAG: hypothetical protein JKY37_10645 [Nannocystaceae bacterium]|nr:hypothetical protein [Nannocystaceae bacterium]